MQERKQVRTRRKKDKEKGQGNSIPSQEVTHVKERKGKLLDNKRRERIQWLRGKSSEWQKLDEDLTSILRS